MTTAQWLIGFHLVGAFLFVSGAVAVGALHALALRRDRPSEIALLLGLTRPAVAVVGVGSIVTLVFGAWLADEDGFSFGDGWISAAFALWVVAVALGSIGGRSARNTRYFAARLAAEGDHASDELRRARLDPVSRALTAAVAARFEFWHVARVAAVAALVGTIGVVGLGESLAADENVNAGWLDASRGLAVFGLLVGGAGLVVLTGMPRLRRFAVPVALWLALIGLATAFVMAAKPA